MKALITGAGGFVGPHLHTHLVDCGDTVVTSDRVGTDGIDITDREAVHELLARHRPDVVYHLAAVTHVNESWREPNRVLRINVEGTANVLDACIAAGVSRVLVVGSAEEYGKVDAADLPLREDSPLRPTTPYGASKVAASFFALQAYLGRGARDHPRAILRSHRARAIGSLPDSRARPPSRASRAFGLRRDRRRRTRPCARHRRRPRLRARVPPARHGGSARCGLQRVHRSWARGAGDRRQARRDVDAPTALRRRIRISSGPSRWPDSSVTTPDCAPRRAGNRSTRSTGPSPTSSPRPAPPRW